MQKSFDEKLTKQDESWKQKQEENQKSFDDKLSQNEEAWKAKNADLEKTLKEQSDKLDSQAKDIADMKDKL